jgi:multicomponent Na+:H+ antiporter subunit F
VTTANLIIVLVLLVNVGAGLARVVGGPRPADIMQAALLVGTLGVAVLIILAQAMGQPALRDVALVFALLASVVTVAFARRADAGRSP